MENLKKIQQLLKDRPDVLFYRWHGVTFSEQDIFSRLDKTFLYLLRPDEVVQRIIGYPELNGKETRIEFTSDVSYRITTGKRKGRVVSPRKINPDERFETATVYKTLRKGKEANELNVDNRSDALLLDALDELAENVPEVSPTISFPKLYICCKGDQRILYPRQSGETLTYFKSFDEYDDKKTLEQNSKKILDDDNNSLNAGADRKAFLFEYVYGKGVIAVDLELDGKWLCVHRSNASLVHDYIKFDLEYM